MPLYLYRDQAGHEQEIIHRMLYTTGVVCVCGAPMHRVAWPVAVNWNGDSSRHPLHPRIRRLVDSAPQRRDEYLRKKEAYEIEKRRIGRD